MKVPAHAIRSKLTGHNIVDVKQDDMLAFPNLTHLDVSDNSLQLHQLSHLLSLRELDL